MDELLKLLGNEGVIVAANAALGIHQNKMLIMLDGVAALGGYEAELHAADHLFLGLFIAGEEYPSAIG